MNVYGCWFCDEAIERSDAGAVMVSVASLWRWDAGSRDEDDPFQSFYAHSTCAKTHLKGATMSLEPEIFGEEC